MPMIADVGCVHGRFQPFHKGHEEYALAALARCKHLFIGITQYDRGSHDPDSPAHRLDKSENPFSFWQRLEIVELVLAANQVPRSQFSIVPFPIDSPSSISEFVPADAVMFTTVYDDWNIKKIQRLEAAGYNVCVLWRREHKEFVGAEVRAALQNDHSLARKLVSESAFATISRYFSTASRAA
jgi:nicotinamide mononucleotide adenylyltransferase